MYKFNRVKTIICALVLTFGLSYTANAATYTVSKGDSLYIIGNLFNTPYNTIIQDNKLSNTTIYPGQSLYVQSGSYTVKSGDNLYRIALNNRITLDRLRKINNLWTDYVYVGQKLNLPKAGSTTTPIITPSTAVIPYTANDLDLLARLITAEAENQPYNAMVSVGAVVINRVKDSRYPNTLHDVIYQIDHGYYQFSPVLNGFINKPASETAKNAAYAALHGNDPTHGALYYFDDSTTNTWLWSKSIALRVGNMVFTYYN